MLSKFPIAVLLVSALACHRMAVNKQDEYTSISTRPNGYVRGGHDTTFTHTCTHATHTQVLKHTHAHTHINMQETEQILAIHSEQGKFMARGFLIH